MKNFLNISKWILGQIRPFILSLISIITLGAVLSLANVGLAVSSKLLLDSATEGNLSKVFLVVSLYLGIIITVISVQRIISIMSARTIELISNKIRQNIYEHILISSWVDLSKYHSGDIVTRMTRDIGILSNVLVNVILGMFSLGVQLIVAFFVLLSFEPALAVAVFVLGPAGILFSRYFGRKLKKFHKKLQETEGEYRSFIHESIQNLLVVKSFCLEKRYIQYIDDLQNERLGWVLQKSKASSNANTVLSSGYWLGYFITFIWGAYLIYKGTATFGTFTAFIQLVGQVQGPFEGLAYKFPQLISAAASAERLMEIDMLDIEEKIEIAADCIDGGIVFENVVFKYEYTKPVMDRVSFNIYPGEIAALIGGSGEGKTTIIRLVLSLIYPEFGCIYFTGKKGERIKCCPSTRRLLSYVPQGNTLFSGTIRENLYLGNPEADEFELIKALSEASAWDFVEELPYGMETVIGEHGIGLSEGQAQRIAIARALLRKAPILILDEATSALDIDTEVRVLEAIKALDHKPTCIIITHRKSVMEMCSKVLKLEDGKINGSSFEAISNQVDEAV